MSSTTTHALAATAGASAGASVALLMVHFGPGPVIGAAALLFLAGSLVAGLLSTASDRRHGRGEWADVDQWRELDHTLRGDR